MSTDSGTGKVIDQALRDAQALVRQAVEQEAEQLDMLGEPDAEDVAEARELLGAAAGPLTVLKEAREQAKARGGRKKGSINRRTDDFRKYLLQFGQHPAITMMQISSAPEEVLMERSRREKVHSFDRFGNPNIVTEQMTFEAATALRLRASEGLLPYMESKKPVALDVSFAGIGDLHIEGLPVGAVSGEDVIDADFLPFDDDQGKGE